ncbi:hypothetical protein Q3O60_13470 [Alkalimonas collagenimarina]|uniref:Uncharacterized protein n=1 Tax=Alkalimonas collagenimarina TaxID=400390 RepID=A0ABT9H1K2_9GAMM|nr:hypothetical protein [Alkalimonas collagenimarina]MDP4537196.1 hypothetical protein [Alkalimonas collagenimarina]
MGPKATPPKTGLRPKRLNASRSDRRVTAGVRWWLYRLLIIGIVLVAVLFFVEALIGIWQESF